MIYFDLRLFNNSVFEFLEALTYLDPRLRGDDGRSHNVVIPTEAGIQGINRLLPRISWGGVNIQNMVL